VIASIPKEKMTAQFHKKFIILNVFSAASSMATKQQRNYGHSKNKINKIKILSTYPLKLRAKGLIDC
jgi:hypothetical protein